MEEDLEMEIRDILLNGLMCLRKKFINLRKYKSDPDTFRYEIDLGIFLCEELFQFVDHNVNQDNICSKTKICPYRQR